MNAQRKDEIYNRILELKFTLDNPTIPNPRLLNEKLGECRVQMEEIERFSIEIYRALSVMQTAFNNAEAEYETKKEQLLTSNEIKNLPNIKDREAQVNSQLKAEIATAKNYKNEIDDLKYLLRAISLKSKNLNTYNNDIKSHVRIMESQIKMSGNASLMDPAAQSLLAEFKKSRMNKDTFEDASTEASENNVVDPSEPVDIITLLSQGVGEGLEGLPEIKRNDNNLLKSDDNLLNPEPVLDPENNGTDPNLLKPEDDLLSHDQFKTPDNLSKEEKDFEESENLPFIEESPFEGLDIEVSPSTEENVVKTIDPFDLDRIIDVTHNEGGTPQAPQKVSQIEGEIVGQKKEEAEALNPISNTGPSTTTTIIPGIDLDALLDDLNLTKESQDG